MFLLANPVAATFQGSVAGYFTPTRRQVLGSRSIRKSIFGPAASNFRAHRSERRAALIVDLRKEATMEDFIFAVLKLGCDDVLPLAFHTYRTDGTNIPAVRF